MNLFKGQVLAEVFGVEPAEALRRVGELTPRELEIAGLYAVGKDTDEISTMLGCAVRTLTVHRTAIRRKLEVPNTGFGAVLFSAKLKEYP